MESFEFNKMLGALLGTCFVVMSIALLSDAIFYAPHPEKEGYEIVAAETPAGGAAEEQAPQPIGPLLASADVKAGEAVFKKCQACHTGEKGGPNKVGPDLWDVVNRPIATHEGFAYSAGMKEFSQGGTVHWDYDHLDGFLTSPKGYVKGTAMTFAGLKKIQERADVIAYLRTLSDNPAPLPEASAAPAEGAAAPAEGAAAPAEGTPAPAPAEGATPPAEGAAPAPAPAEPAPAQ